MGRYRIDTGNGVYEVESPDQAPQAPAAAPVNYKSIRNQIVNQQYRAALDAAKSPAEVADLFAMHERTGQENAAINTRNEIRTRPSMIRSVIDNPPSLQVPNSWDATRHDLQSLLRTAGAGFEAAEGSLASPALDLQAGRPQDIPQHIGDLLQGKNPAQYGDVFKASNLPGISNPKVAAALGLILAAHPNTPSGAMGEAIGKSISKTLSPLKGPLSKLIYGLTGGKVPVKHAIALMENPELMNTQAVQEEANAANTALGRVRTPLRMNPSKTIDIKHLMTPAEGSILTPLEEELGIYAPAGNGGITRTGELSQMAPPQQKLIQKWLTKLRMLSAGGRNPTFNEVDSLIQEMDQTGENFLAAARNGTGPNATPFVAKTSAMRQALSAALKEQYPEVGAALERSASANFNKAVNRSFTYLKNQQPSFFHSLPLRVALQAGGVPGGAAGISAYGGTMPYLTGQAIRGGAAALENPTAILLAAKKGAENNSRSASLEMAS